jgi:hypothetical protein
MPVNEALELERRLPDAVGVPLEAIVVNGMWPERFSAAEGETMRSAMNDGLRPEAAETLLAALTVHERSRAQRSHLRRLRRATSTHVVTLPYLFGPELGLPEYERLASQLARRL